MPITEKHRVDYPKSKSSRICNKKHLQEYFTRVGMDPLRDIQLWYARVLGNWALPGYIIRCIVFYVVLICPTPYLKLFLVLVAWIKSTTPIYTSKLQMWKVRRLSLMINNQNYKRNEDNVKIKLEGSHKKPTIKTTTLLNCQRRVSPMKTKPKINSANTSTSNY